MIRDDVQTIDDLICESEPTVKQIDAWVRLKTFLRDHCEEDPKPEEEKTPECVYCTHSSVGCCIVRKGNCSGYRPK